MTPQKSIKKFLAALTAHTYTSSSTFETHALDDAVRASSKFSSLQDAIDQMKAAQISAECEAVEEILGIAYRGKTLSQISSTILTSDIKSKIESRRG